MHTALYRLMTWLSPSFPVGAYTYSHGLEWAVESGALKNRADLEAWVSGILQFGAGRMDADLFREAHRAITTNDPPRFTRAADWADALRGTAELALESTNQGRAFLLTLEKTWPHPDLADWLARFGDRPPAYALAVATACALHGVPLREGLAAFLHALAANLISAAVRLVPLGQTDGQWVQAALAPVVEAAVTASLARPWEDLGAAAVGVDLCSMFHETQYTRLFRS